MRWLFQTTTTSTTTVSTFTVCYTTAAAINTACTGRRKRAIVTDPLEELKELMPDLIIPSRAVENEQVGGNKKIK